MRTTFLSSLIRSSAAPLRRMERVVIVAERRLGAVARERARLV
jgi:hypothetical protein